MKTLADKMQKQYSDYMLCKSREAYDRMYDAQAASFKEKLLDRSLVSGYQMPTQFTLFDDAVLMNKSQCIDIVNKYRGMNNVLPVLVAESEHPSYAPVAFCHEHNPTFNNSLLCSEKECCTRSQTFWNLTKKRPDLQYR